MEPRSDKKSINGRVTSAVGGESDRNHKEMGFIRK